jgi:hypothetical protein
MKNVPIHLYSNLARCSVCARIINVHQQVRGGTCDDASCRATAVKRLLAMQRTELQAERQRMARSHVRALLPQHLGVEALTVVVPGLRSPLRATLSERRDRLHDHIARAVAESAEHDPEFVPEAADAAFSSPTPAIATACALCRGFCCRNGGDRAYIDAGTLRRIRSQRPGTSADELIASYTDAVPERSVEHSCIFHGVRGCALPRDLRSSTCNDYLCEPLKDWSGRAAQSPGAPTGFVVLHDNRVVGVSLHGAGMNAKNANVSPRNAK